MEAPTRKHKPIVSVDDYDKKDGQYARKTDTMALSLGFAQYNKPELPREKKELSLKTWRMGDNGWSRMSEELPIHRNLDLSKLFLEALIEGSNQESGIVSERQKLHLHVDNGSYEDIMNYYKKNQLYFISRLRDLQRLLERWERITLKRPDLIPMRDVDKDDDEFEENIELSSPTSWHRFRGESDEDYQERMEDQESWLESFDD